MCLLFFVHFGNFFLKQASVNEYLLGIAARVSGTAWEGGVPSFQLAGLHKHRGKLIQLLCFQLCHHLCHFGAIPDLSHWPFSVFKHLLLTSSAQWLKCGGLVAAE